MCFRDSRYIHQSRESFSVERFLTVASASLKHAPPPPHTAGTTRPITLTTTRWDSFALLPQTLSSVQHKRCVAQPTQWTISPTNSEISGVKARRCIIPGSYLLAHRALLVAKLVSETPASINFRQQSKHVTFLKVLIKHSIITNSAVSVQTSFVKRTDLFSHTE